MMLVVMLVVITHNINNMLSDDDDVDVEEDHIIYIYIHFAYSIISVIIYTVPYKIADHAVAEEEFRKFTSTILQIPCLVWHQ
jgi:hypothetical protein